MRTVQGDGVSGGVAIGPMHVITRAASTAEKRSVSDVDAELRRFHEAQQTALRQLTALREKTARELGESKAELFDAHRMMVEDPDYVGNIEREITGEQVNAEYAVSQAAQQFAGVFASMDNEYMRARAADVKDVSGRVIAILDGTQHTGESGDAGGRPFIIAADELQPSETAQLNRSLVLGFVNQKGSQNSHSAILARTMGLPAVNGVGEQITSADEGSTVIVDGDSGQVIVNPDESTLATFGEKKTELDVRRRALEGLKNKPSVTRGGQHVRLNANIARPADLTLVRANGADGIGLFRSEFLYLESDDYPSEDEQFAAYTQVAEQMEGKEVVIRTLDIGADKQVGYFNLEPEANPALGLRAIRICLTRPEIFKTQLRALYRASAFGNISIMLPMIISVDEVRRAKAIMAEVRGDLSREGLAFSEHVPVGIMIETPASVIMADELAKEVDFFSVGTNDLTQYTLACDRQNPNLKAFANPHHPAILRMIRKAADAAHREGDWIGICGELGADPTLTEEFLNMGIDELSVSPSSILPLREKIRSL